MNEHSWWVLIQATAGKLLRDTVSTESFVKQSGEPTAGKRTGSQWTPHPAAAPAQESKNCRSWGELSAPRPGLTHRPPGSPGRHRAKGLRRPRTSVAECPFRGAHRYRPRPRPPRRAEPRGPPRPSPHGGPPQELRISPAARSRRQRRPRWASPVRQRAAPPRRDKGALRSTSARPPALARPQRRPPPSLSLLLSHPDPSGRGAPALTCRLPGPRREGGAR